MRLPAVVLAGDGAVIMLYPDPLPWMVIALDAVPWAVIIYPLAGAVSAPLPQLMMIGLLMVAALSAVIADARLG